MNCWELAELKLQCAAQFVWKRAWITELNLRDHLQGLNLDKG